MESAPPRIEIHQSPRAAALLGGGSPPSSSSGAAMIDFVDDKFDILETLGGARRFVVRHALLVTSLLWFLSGAQISLSLFVTQEPPRFPMCRPGDTSCRPSIALDVKDCSTPYHYMRPGISIVSTYDVPTSACEPRPWMNVAWIHSALFFGMLVGALTIAPMADKKGRRPVMTMGVLALTVAAIYSTMAPTIYVYGLARFIVGCSLSACCLPSMAILSEITLSRKRQWIVAVQAVSFCIAAGYVALLACVIPSWRLLTILVTLPAFFFVCGFPCCGGVYIESPRWLAAKGRMDDAFSTWMRIARISQIDLPDDLNLDVFVKNELQATHERLIKSDSDLEEELSMMSVRQMVTPDTLAKAFRTFPASIWIWVSIWIWIVTAFVYYGVLLDFGDLIASLRMEGWESALLHHSVSNITATPPATATAGRGSGAVGGGAAHPHIAANVVNNNNINSHPINGAQPPNIAAAAPAPPPLRHLVDLDTLSTVARMLSSSSSTTTTTTSSSSLSGTTEHIFSSVMAVGAGEAEEEEQSDSQSPHRQANVAAASPALSVGKPLGSLQSPITPPKKVFVPSAPGGSGSQAHGAAAAAAAVDGDGDGPKQSPPAPLGMPAGSSVNSADDNKKDLQDVGVSGEEEAFDLNDNNNGIPKNPSSAGNSPSRLSTITSILDKERAAAYLQYLSDVGTYVKNGSLSLYESAKSLPHEAERLYDEMAMQKRLDQFYSDVSAQFIPTDPMAPYWQKMRLEGLLVLVSFALEIPAYAIAMFLAGVRRIGRKSTSIGLLALGGVCICLAYGVQFAGLSGVRLSAMTLSFVVVGRCCIAAVFQLLYLYSAELFPTSIRGSTLGLFSASARVGCIVAAPLATYLDGLHNGLALCFFGALCLSAALCGINALPETLNQPLYDTLDTLEDIYARSHFADKFFGSYGMRLCAFIGRGTCCLQGLFSRCLGLPTEIEQSSFEAKGHAWLKKQWRKSRGTTTESRFVPITAGDGKDPAPLASATTVRTFELGELDDSYDEDSQRPRFDV